MEVQSRSARYFCALIMTLLVGCTRQSSNTTNLGLNFSFPQKIGAQALTGYIPTEVMVNVGAGQPGTKIFSWSNPCRDNNSSEASCLVVPPIAIEVDNGSDRLIQVLVVLENTTTESMAFRYGDKLENLTGGPKNVNIEVLPFGTSNGQEARFSGRFIGAGGEVPSGKLQALFQPPGAKPVMTLDVNQAIYAGWSEFFAIDQIPLKFVVQPSGIVIGEFEYSSANGYIKFNGTPITTSTQVMRVSLPPHYVSHSTSWNAAEARFRSQIDYFTGFFGPGASGKSVVYTTSGTIGNVKQTVAGSGDITWDHDGTCNSASTSVCRLAGGTTSTGTTEHVDYLEFRHGLLKNGTEGLSGFRGPFQIFNINGYQDFLGLSADGPNFTVGFRLLPGVLSGNGAIDGIAIFFKPNASNTRDILCKNALSEGFVFINNVTNDDPYSFPKNGVTSGAVALCPYKNTLPEKYLGRAMVRSVGGGGGGGGGGTATGIKLEPRVTMAGAGFCVPINVRGDDSGNYGNIASPTSVTVVTSSGQLYDNPGCTTGGNATKVFTLGGPNPSGISTFLLDGSPGVITLTASAPGLTGDTESVEYEPSAPSTRITVLAPPSESQYRCMQLLAIPHDGTMPQVSDAFYSGVTVTAGGDVTGTFYTDSQCTTGASGSGSLVYFSGDSGKEFYFMASTPGTVTFTVDDGVGPLVAGAATNVTINAAGTAARVVAYGPPSFILGDCSNQVTIELQDSMGNPTAIPSGSETVGLPSSWNTSYYTSYGDCMGSTSPQASVVFSAGVPRIKVNLNPIRAFTGPFILTPTTLTADSSYVASLSPGSASNLIFVLPGQTFTPGQINLANAVTGTPSAQPLGGPYDVVSYITDSKFNVVASTNGSCGAGNILSDDTNDTDPADLTFTNGVANFNLGASSTGTGFTIGGTCSPIGGLTVQTSELYDR